MYDGIAGIGLGMRTLSQLGYTNVEIDYLAMIEQGRELQASTLEQSRGPDHQRGLLIGELGFRAAEYHLAPGNETLAHLAGVIESNLYNTECDLMWGGAGSLLTACSITNEQIAEPLIKKAVAQLKAQLCHSLIGDYRAWMVPTPSGRFVDLLGMVHGFSGNALAIISAFPHLPAPERASWQAEILNTIKCTAAREDHFANWPVGIGGSFLLQQCHGAPGVIACTSSLMNQGDDDFDQLLLDAGELIWHAGPLEKGPNFCHGTSGNGYAFLKLFRQTNDQMWLERARSFAMIAISQARDRLESDKLQPSLWTGDLGLCFYLDACINASDAIPTLDYF